MKVYFNDVATMTVEPETPEERSLLLLWHKFNCSYDTPYSELTGSKGMASLVIAGISDCDKE
ncbi:hypothetical protein [Morganella morganii]|uniref:hypothetical protein n=1 Tax=Morganella morganii TaxID=582 RepID=UPI001BDA0D58|nr:hypothetical protein [Morganella morganii]MBT0520979.1 hypothetical protein [Morganella morganii subsp. morganii]QWL88181.1 hypothetical protein IZ187_11310 [Morganella morganii subsp. morganii]